MAVAQNEQDCSALQYAISLSLMITAYNKLVLAAYLCAATYVSGPLIAGYKN